MISKSYLIIERKMPSASSGGRFLFFTLVCCIYLLGSDAIAGAQKGEQKSPNAKKILDNLTSQHVETRRSAVIKLNLLLKKHGGSAVKNGEHPFFNTLKGGAILHPLLDNDTKVREIGYANLQFISSLNLQCRYLKNKARKGKPIWDFSKYPKLKKHLLKIITEGKESEREEATAIVSYYSNFSYDAEAKEEIIGQFWKTNSNAVKGSLVFSVLYWQLSKTKEGHKILLAGIKDGDIEVRIAALQVIQKTTPPKLLKPLIDRLDHQEFTLRELSYITFAVLMYGEKAKPYQDVLIATQKELERNRLDIKNVLDQMNKKKETP